MSDDMGDLRSVHQAAGQQHALAQAGQATEFPRFHAAIDTVGPAAALANRHRFGFQLDRRAGLSKGQHVVGSALKLGQRFRFRDCGLLRLPRAQGFRQLVTLGDSVPVYYDERGRNCQMPPRPSLVESLVVPRRMR